MAQKDMLMSTENEITPSSNSYSKPFTTVSLNGETEDSDEWEYEYSNTETETYYVTLDLTTPHPIKQPDAKKYKVGSGDIWVNPALTQSARHAAAGQGSHKRRNEKKQSQSDDDDEDPLLSDEDVRSPMTENEDDDDKVIPLPVKGGPKGAYNEAATVSEHLPPTMPSHENLNSTMNKDGEHGPKEAHATSEKKKAGGQRGPRGPRGPYSKTRARLQAPAAAAAPEPVPLSKIKPSLVQILDLHSKNPIVSYGGKIFACEWAKNIGTEMLFMRHNDNDPLPVLRNLRESVDLVAASSIRITSKPVVLQPNTGETGRASRSQESFVKPSIPLRNKAEREENQANFLAQLMIIKDKKGEQDEVTMITKKTATGGEEVTKRRGQMNKEDEQRLVNEGKKQPTSALMERRSGDPSTPTPSGRSGSTPYHLRTRSATPRTSTMGTPMNNGSSGDENGVVSDGAEARDELYDDDARYEEDDMDWE